MDEEDFDFAAPSNSRSTLSSLFHSDNTPGDVNQALTFTAPKQPRKNDNAQGAAGTLKLIHAVVVHTYKLKDGNYTNQGKLGCAILGHHETYSYKLLLYKGKQVQVTVVSITPNFIFHVQPSNYANFYDEKKENWSINFDSETALVDFTKQVILAKANSQGKSPTSLVMQDLYIGEGQPLGNGDSAEVKYSGWLLSNFVFGQMFDSNMNSDSLFRIRLGKGKVIKGWNDGLLGMQRGGKRLLVIPPDLGYGLEGMGNIIPPNSTLIFEIHVIKIKIARESSHSPSPSKISVVETVVEKKPEVPPRQSFSQEDNIRMRGASISEQLTQSPKRDKAQLISRMAKMGTATLPFQGAIAAHVSSDSESEVDVPQPSSPAPQNISRTSSPKAFSKPRSRTNSGPPPLTAQPLQAQSISDPTSFHVSQSSSQMSYVQSTMSTPQSFVCAAPPFPTYQPPMHGQYSMPQSPYSMHNIPGMIPPTVATSMGDSHFSLLITETRSQNMEVRMGLSKITDKVDTVIQKVDDMRFQGRSVNTSMPIMENSVILQNIERIIQENTRLKEDIEAKGSKIQSLNEIICDFFQRNPRFSEERSSIVEQKKESLLIESAQSEEKISNLEEEKTKLQLDLSSATSKLKKIEADLLKYQELENELQQKLSEAQKETKQNFDLFNDTKEQLSENLIVVSSLQEKVKSVEHEKDLLNEKLQSVEKEHTKSQGSTDLVEIYKKEIKEYKEKVEQLNSIISNSVSSEKLEEEKQKIKLELAETSKLKEEMETEMKEMKKKIDSYEELKLSYEDNIRKLKAEVDSSHTLKKKYEIFQEKTRALKETYDKQIVELMNEVRHLQSMKSGSSPDFSVEIKRVMNRLYKILQGKFEPDTPYAGSKVLETVLQAIMNLTLQILKNKNQSSGDHSNTPESSEKEVVLTEDVSNSNETIQTEFAEQNGVIEPKVGETAVSDELLTNSNLSLADKTNVKPEIPSDNASKDSDVPEMVEKSEANINSETGSTSKIEEESNIQTNEPIKCESPESNTHQPSSNIFSDLLSGTEGTKIWRPQPPPLFDDDDDDDDDDDWLK